MLAVAETEEPTEMEFSNRLIVIPGLAFRTLNGSQAPVTGLLFASPVYAAWKL
jgi:hypothetical protein